RRKSFRSHIYLASALRYAPVYSPTTGLQPPPRTLLVPSNPSRRGKKRGEVRVPNGLSWKVLEAYARWEGSGRCAAVVDGGGEGQGVVLGGLAADPADILGDRPRGRCRGPAPVPDLPRDRRYVRLDPSCASCSRRCPPLSLAVFSLFCQGLTASLGVGRDFIAPCKCKGTSKYVHRDCLDHWRAVKEGFAFSHCTTCKAPYYLRVHVHTDRKWRTLKFRFFVTRDILFIFALVQFVISALAYLVHFIDGYQQYWLRTAWGFDNEVTFYYICGALLFFALLGLSGCFITCYDRRVRSDLAQPCRELCLCCCQPGMCADCHLPGTLCMWTDCTTCFEGCATTAGECGGCLGGAGEAGLPLLLIMGVIVLGLFTVVGIFYSVLVATMVGQRIWQRHYHILAKRMLTKEYVVEDVDGERADWSPPPLPAEHVQQLKSLGLL
uniref:RING-CH-type domain-containing protein n=1 Tax=Triticum urartu TaxID=4572 RepID=A0A8R7Q4A6_TRIUA